MWAHIVHDQASETRGEKWKENGKKDDKSHTVHSHTMSVQYIRV